MNRANLMDVLRQAKQATNCVCGNGKARGKSFCPRCLRIMPDDVKYGVRSVLPSNEARGYREAVHALEKICVLRDGAATQLFGGAH